jgi:hypothetical protein
VVFCLDSGLYRAVDITTSATIDCSSVSAGILPGGTAQAGITVNAARIDVIVRGLTIFGAGTESTGIEFIQGASLRVENCVIQGFQRPPALGIRFLPGGGAAQLFVSDTLLAFNGNATTGGGGILVAPRAGAALLTLQRVQLDRNFEGLRASGASGGATFASVLDSVATTNSSYGFIAVNPAGGPQVVMDIQRSTSTLNGGAGIRASGPSAQVTIGASAVTLNAIGLSAVNGGVIRSYGNNAVTGNSVNGAASGPIVLQ